MISLSEKAAVSAPADEVWAVLKDPALVASCIPGAALADQRPDGKYEGSLAIKFGPTVATFRGEVALSYDDAARTVTIEGRGIDQRGASRAIGSGEVAVKGDAGTEINVSGSYNVTGPLQMFASAGGVHVARALLAEFAANLARLIEERRAPQASVSPSSAQDIAAGESGLSKSQPKTLNAAALLLRIVANWFRDIITRIKRQ